MKGLPFVHSPRLPGRGLCRSCGASDNGAGVDKPPFLTRTGPSRWQFALLAEG